MTWQNMNPCAWRPVPPVQRKIDDGDVTGHTTNPSASSRQRWSRSASVSQMTVCETYASPIGTACVSLSLIRALSSNTMDSYLGSMSVTAGTRL